MKYHFRLYQVFKSRFVAFIPQTIIITAAMQNTATGASSPSSNEKAAASQTLIFWGYIIVSALVLLGTILLFRAGARVQDSIKSDADARIAEAGVQITKVESESKLKIEQIEADRIREKQQSDEKITALQADAEKLKSVAELARAESAKATESTAVARKEAAEAIAKAEGFRLEIAKAVEGTAEANRKAEEERLARIKIEERLAPRHVNEEQRNIITAMLLPFKGRQIDITAWAGPEPEQFMGEVALAFQRAGIIVNGSTMVGSGTFPGITVGMPGGNNSDPFGLALVSALIRAGIVTPPVTVFASGANVRLSIGTKP